MTCLADGLIEDALTQENFCDISRTHHERTTLLFIIGHAPGIKLHIAAHLEVAPKISCGNAALTLLPA